MALALFSRLSRQLEDAAAELKALLDGHTVALKARRESPKHFDRYLYLGGTAQGIASIYTALEQVMEAIVSEIDGMRIRGEDYHEKLVRQLAVRVEGVRDALVSEHLLGLLLELRRFRHVVRHNYSSRLDEAKVEENLGRIKQALPLFERDYHRLRESLEAEEPAPPAVKRKR